MIIIYDNIYHHIEVILILPAALLSIIHHKFTDIVLYTIDFSFCQQPALKLLTIQKVISKDESNRINF